MSYSAYYKRVNRYGNNLQERVQGKKEHDFLTFMSKSPNLVRARNGEDEKYYEAVLQTKEYDQDEVTSYLLVPLDEKIPMGTVIHTLDSRHSEERQWINYAIDPYTSTGYNRYTIVELESQLMWVNNGIKYTSLAHATGGGSGARDKNINLKFNVQFSEAGVYLPNKRYSVIMPTNENLKKNMKVTLEGETWRVTGFDSISVKGVSYVTLEEALTDKKEDIPVANYSDLKNWTITTSLGNNFVIPFGEKEVELQFYYKNNLMDNVQYYLLEDNNFSTSINGKTVTIQSKTRSFEPMSLKVIIEGWNDEDFIEIPFSFGAVSGLEKAIIGPQFMYVGDTKEYHITNCEDFDEETIKIEENCADIISAIYDKEAHQFIIKVKGKTIGKCNLSIGEVFFPIEILSMWLGGNE